ncbi:hypothetical protein BS47DRAFT_1490468 [Hydnum rufescens UP504]|uniref:Uncharacterized protein n=1 Tax=Hydnum rufescens UP504 TaxID=1448309 RepID=A0A9P6ACL5_9AGAM|nr:hypothetical protein BS47DRAFT_1490468 [Hydnum rufescens UP504]
MSYTYKYENSAHGKAAADIGISKIIHYWHHTFPPTSAHNQLRYSTDHRISSRLVLLQRNPVRSVSRPSSATVFAKFCEEDAAALADPRKTEALRDDNVLDPGNCAQQRYMSQPLSDVHAFYPPRFRSLWNLDAASDCDEDHVLQVFSPVETRALCRSKPRSPLDHSLQLRVGPLRSFLDKLCGMFSDVPLAQFVFSDTLVSPLIGHSLQFYHLMHGLPFCEQAPWTWLPVSGSWSVSLPRKLLIANWGRLKKGAFYDPGSCTIGVTETGQTSNVLWRRSRRRFESAASPSTPFHHLPLRTWDRVAAIEVPALLHATKTLIVSCDEVARTEQKVKI